MSIKGQCMKESNTLVDNVAIRQLQREILLGTKKLCMKESTLHCCFQTRQISNVTRKFCHTSKLFFKLNIKKYFIVFVFVTHCHTYVHKVHTVHMFNSISCFDRVLLSSLLGEQFGKHNIILPQLAQLEKLEKFQFVFWTNPLPIHPPL